MSEIKLPKITNYQYTIVRRCWAVGFIFCALAIAVFIDGHTLSGVWAVALVSIFGALCALVCVFIFRSRGKKLDRLLTGQELFESWQMNKEMKRMYAENISSASIAKNKGIMILLSILFTVITIPFLFFLESDERLLFLAIMASILLVVFIASQALPRYYRHRNLHGDGWVLIGAKYAYICGYLHNWDFPLSGLRSVKSIKSPFRGLQLVYYYTDRTFRHEHEIRIPVPEQVNLRKLIEQLRSADT